MVRNYYKCNPKCIFLHSIHNGNTVTDITYNHIGTISCTFRVRNVCYTNIALHIHTLFHTENRLKDDCSTTNFYELHMCVYRIVYIHMCYAMYWIYPDSAECIELPERKWRCYGLSNFIQMEVCVLVCRRTSYQLLKNKINIFLYILVWYNMKTRI